MSIAEMILACAFALGITAFGIGAGIAIVWMAIEDTALGRAIDKAVDDFFCKRGERTDHDI